LLAKIRREYAQLITSGGQLVLLFVGFKLDSREGWLGSLSMMALISLIAWMSALRRLRLINATPTSKVSSAAQGYVELIGTGKPYEEALLISKLRVLPCLWYRYKVEQRGHKNKWNTIDHGESKNLFSLHDDSGTCVVDPEHAEIITKHRDRWTTGNYRYTEWKLIHHDSIYALGEFRTHNVAAEFDQRAELNNLLADWKRDMPELHARFDLDEDGELDMKEWMLARSAARREVSKKMQVAHTQSDVHIMGQPRDGKLYLLSNIAPNKLSRRYLFWSWAHLLIFFGALVGCGWMMQAT